MLALMLGTVLSMGALAFVLSPLFAGAHVMPARQPPPAGEQARAAEREAVAALREIEFDRATGKLSDGDYNELKSRYTEGALDAMRRVAAATSGDDAVEAAVLAYRGRLEQCARCGPRPEPNASHCSSCGSYLPGTCNSCGAVVPEAGATFCARCGRRLAA